MILLTTDYSPLERGRGVLESAHVDNKTDKVDVF